MNIEQIREMQPFKSVKEMDKHVRAFLFRMKPALSEGTLKVLSFIWRHSVKYRGVSFAKIATIEKNTTLSRRTVIRAINRLVEEKLLKRVETTKANGKRGVNLLIILQQEDLFLPDDVTPNDTPSDTASISLNPPCDKLQQIKKQVEAKRKQYKNSSCNPVLIDHSFIPSFIPKPFIDTAKPFLSPRDVLEAWRTVETACKNVTLRYPASEYLPTVQEVFKQAVFAKKHNMIRTSFMGYFYGGLKNRLTEVVRKEVVNNPTSVYFN
ncbi:helix-turn-helix domain-containing protein [Halobacillus sp. Marseille-Q1614]|uniref:helix-turn-helix domain-containing protein n=1 Tax=Halobacillus sp. Marseille-Q1614 TaxID=2709134 RepID=UPI00156DC56D|nr:helix-turn-helix domain-containing protein [Halobacillus sp. Marseille-Q1614]